jgi:AcrR family transcriptional regulator
VAPRRYVSEVRSRQAQQTRMAVLMAARQMFVERGWAATGVRSVAEQAGVSVKTIYDAFGSKAELFKAVTDVAAAGDAEPVTVMEREQFAALAEGELGQRAAAGARLALAVNRRTVDLMRVWRTAADTDAALAQMLTEDVERQRQTFVAAVTLIAGHEIERQRAEGLWALMNEESYRLLVRSCGWTDEQYEQWLAETITRLLDTEQPQTRGAR